MSLVFNMVGGGSGGGDVFAFILATYPADSTCSATNGTTTLSASDTSGFFVFKIPTPASVPETWTVTSTDGTDTATAYVVISTEGQSESVTLVYWQGEIYKNGNQYTSVTGGFQTFKIASNVAALGTATFGDSSVVLSNSADGSIAIAPVNKLDVTDFSTLTVVVTNMFSSSGRAYMFIADSVDNIQMNNQSGYIQRENFPSAGTYTMDISSLTGEYYIGVGYWYASATSMTVTEFYMT